jgi:hypothetical protein
VQYNHHLRNGDNFSSETRIRCLTVDSQGGGMYRCLTKMME